MLFLFTIDDRGGALFVQLDILIGKWRNSEYRRPNFKNVILGLFINHYHSNRLFIF